MLEDRLIRGSYTPLFIKDSGSDQLTDLLSKAYSVAQGVDKDSWLLKDRAKNLGDIYETLESYMECDSISDVEKESIRNTILETQDLLKNNKTFKKHQERVVKKAYDTELFSYVNKNDETVQQLHKKYDVAPTKNVSISPSVSIPPSVLSSPSVGPIPPSYKTKPDVQSMNGSISSQVYEKDSLQDTASVYIPEENVRVFSKEHMFSEIRKHECHPFNPTPHDYDKESVVEQVEESYISADSKKNSNTFQNSSRKSFLKKAAVLGAAVLSAVSMYTCSMFKPNDNETVLSNTNKTYMQSKDQFETIDDYVGLDSKDASQMSDVPVQRDTVHKTEDISDTTIPEFLAYTPGIPAAESSNSNTVISSDTLEDIIDEVIEEKTEGTSEPDVYVSKNNVDQDSVSPIPTQDMLLIQYQQLSQRVASIDDPVATIALFDAMSSPNLHARTIQDAYQALQRKLRLSETNALTHYALSDLEQKTMGIEQSILTAKNTLVDYLIGPEDLELTAENVQTHKERVTSFIALYDIILENHPSFFPNDLAKRHTLQNIADSFENINLTNRRSAQLHYNEISNAIIDLTNRHINPSNTLSIPRFYETLSERLDVVYDRMLHIQIALLADFNPHNDTHLDSLEQRLGQIRTRVSQDIFTDRTGNQYNFLAQETEKLEHSLMQIPTTIADDMFAQHMKGTIQVQKTIDNLQSFFERRNSIYRDNELSDPKSQEVQAFLVQLGRFERTFDSFLFAGINLENTMSGSLEDLRNAFKDIFSE